MSSLKEKLHLLINTTNDPIVLENIYQYLNRSIEKRNLDILDELSSADLNSLNESLSEYKKGELRSHDEILEMLKEWRSK